MHYFLTWFLNRLFNLLCGDAARILRWYFYLSFEYSLTCTTRQTSNRKSFIWRWFSVIFKIFTISIWWSSVRSGLILKIIFHRVCNVNTTRTRFYQKPIHYKLLEQLQQVWLYFSLKRKQNFRSILFYKQSKWSSTPASTKTLHETNHVSNWLRLDKTRAT